MHGRQTDEPMMLWTGRRDGVALGCRVPLNMQISTGGGWGGWGFPNRPPGPWVNAFFFPRLAQKFPSIISGPTWGRGYGSQPTIPPPPPTNTAPFMVTPTQRGELQLQIWSGGLVARPRPRASCLGPCTTAHLSLTSQHRYSADCCVYGPSARGQDHELTWPCERVCLCEHVSGTCACVGLHCVWVAQGQRGPVIPESSAGGPDTP